jgi:predicted nucleic acid-binding protein
MWLWDSNIVRHFGDQHPNLVPYLQQISWSDIALPSVVMAEILHGRCEFALKATPSQTPLAHQRLWQTQQFLLQFNVLVFDEKCAEALEVLRQQHKAHKRYADMMIAAMAKAGNHVVVTRNLKDFESLLPQSQLANWIDEKFNQ